MTEIVAGALTGEGFAGFGEVFAAPTDPGRTYADTALANGRPAARPSLSVVLRAPVPPGPVTARRMERHAFSSQSFLPMGPGRYLIMVAPHAAGGRPDMGRARAFLAGPGQCVTYGRDVWHHELTVLDAPLAFGVFMWREGSAGDEEFVDIDPLTIRLP
jgi:ureidoglycolate lyase